MEELITYLTQGDYEKVADILSKYNDIRDWLMRIAYETESLYIYSFTQYMYKQTGTESCIEWAIDLLLNPLCVIEGAYSVALFHARELLRKHRNVENLERILFFSDIPEKLVSNGEAISIAREILRIDPNNKAATLKVDTNEWEH